MPGRGERDTGAACHSHTTTTHPTGHGSLRGLVTSSRAATCPDSCRPAVTDRAQPGRTYQQQQATASPSQHVNRWRIQGDRPAVRSGGRVWRTSSRTVVRARGPQQRLAAWLLAHRADRAPGFRPAAVLAAYRRWGARYWRGKTRTSTTRTATAA